MLEGDDWWRRGKRPDEESFDDGEENWSEAEETDEDFQTCRHCGATLYDEDVALCPKCGRAPSREDMPERAKPLWILLTAVILFIIFVWYAIPH